jgi:hypothetical protein
VLVNGFSKNRQFGAKTVQNSVFLGRDPHIADRLYITAPYMSFDQFWKNSNFHSKSVGVSLRFCRKSLVWGKNWPKLSISWSWPPYYGLDIHNCPVYEFLWVLKKLKFCSISIGEPTDILKIDSFGQKLTETRYFLVVTPILRIGYI